MMVPLLFYLHGRTQSPEFQALPDSKESSLKTKQSFHVLIENLPVYNLNVVSILIYGYVELEW